MEHYYVNKIAQSTGEHEVHKKGCRYTPNNYIDLGEFSNCADAVRAARKHYPNVDGCKTCCEQCHTR